MQQPHPPPWPGLAAEGCAKPLPPSGGAGPNNGSSSSNSCGGDCGGSRAPGADRFTQQLLHLASLMHALACQRLRRDGVLANLVPHSSSPGTEPPKVRQPRFEFLNYYASLFECV